MSGLRAARRRGVAVMNAKSPGGAPGLFAFEAGTSRARRRHVHARICRRSAARRPRGCVGAGGLEIGAKQSAQRTRGPHPRDVRNIQKNA
ncbi:hypothetical protein V4E86_11125 [Burkholderia pseudomallei]|uniref:Uncharacterized protein n=4 Tax=pseudomallei group TaxID=111527 RepID=A2S9L1_BURM9|nr:MULTISPECIES: hypothetical protein [pseudomallei group]EEP88805.1 conserved hypothetical protein [Burkholderia mallei GB8 horse 4]EES47524.1 conserved hypothetical protein [Burkholderia mallei PRL-20]AAU49620.1 hypothetical protein BMA2065 [Burkholderia mallei ATCC 23344]ABM52865.1 conserved hypothetical protein [Burkholderia mallei SAVP1]ABN03357.1 conserved hypothetical protein [Burkholderia mallei NCTC 10229]